MLSAGKFTDIYTLIIIVAHNETKSKQVSFIIKSSLIVLEFTAYKHDISSQIPII